MKYLLILTLVAVVILSTMSAPQKSGPHHSKDEVLNVPVDRNRMHWPHLLGKHSSVVETSVKADRPDLKVIVVPQVCK